MCLQSCGKWWRSLRSAIYYDDNGLNIHRSQTLITAAYSQITLRVVRRSGLETGSFVLFSDSEGRFLDVASTCSLAPRTSVPPMDYKASWSSHIPAVRAAISRLSVPGINDVLLPLIRCIVQIFFFQGLQQSSQYPTTNSYYIRLSTHFLDRETSKGQLLTQYSEESAFWGVRRWRLQTQESIFLYSRLCPLACEKCCELLSYYLSCTCLK